MARRSGAGFNDLFSDLGFYKMPEALTQEFWR